MFLSKTLYKCVVCRKALSEDIIGVNVYIAPSDEIYRPGAGVPFVLAISPCCGDRACVEAAWERAKAGVLGEIEDIELEPEEDEESEETRAEEREPSRVERALLDTKDETLIDEFLEWVAKSELDPHDSRNLLPRFLREIKRFPKTEAFDSGDLCLGFGKPDVVTEKVRLLDDMIRKAVDSRDVTRAETMVPDCVAWASEFGFSTVRKADVEVFLSDKHIRLASVAVHVLWAKTNLQLRAAGRRPAR